MRMKPGDRLDRFEIIEPLGEGAYAETYKARDAATGQVVMIKSPNPLLFADPAIHQRFLREAEIASHLNHPGVQRSVDTAEHRTEPYLALEYIEGENLRRWLRAHPGSLPLSRAVEWAGELADALAYLHSHKIVHRDLKPENIIVTRDEHLKIIDFGTALLTGARRLTWRHLTEALGTPDYMSPEQIQGERGDPRSDVYSLGIMLYEFLTGHVPFQGDNWLAVMAGHLQRDPQPIRQVRPEVPADLEAVTLTAMRRYPDNRYQSAEELLADLRALRLATPALPAAQASAPSTAALEVRASDQAGATVHLVRPASTAEAVRPAVPAYGSSRGQRSTSGVASGAAAVGVNQHPPGSPSLRATSRDLSPEKPIGRLPAPSSTKSLWLFVAMIAGGFIGVVAIIIVASVVLR
ncbi:MAG: hypothetical protein NVSMB32_18370 [Actinomycetota bacterium]